jgi:hypothetical protein
MKVMVVGRPIPAPLLVCQHDDCHNAQGGKFSGRSTVRYLLAEWFSTPGWLLLLVRSSAESFLEKLFLMLLRLLELVTVLLPRVA